MRTPSLHPLSVLSAALWKLLQRWRLCRRRSLTPIANSFLGPVPVALDTMPNDPSSERNVETSRLSGRPGALVGHEVADKIALMRNRRVGLIIIAAPSRGR